MKRVYPLLWILGLALLESTLLPFIFPAFPLTPALVALVFVSLRFQRPYFLIAALWAGLIQDILLSEHLGLFMLLRFCGAALAWEIKNELIDNLVLTGMLRLIAMSLTQDVLTAFILYISGLRDLGPALQINAGVNLLANLVLYGLFLLVIKLFHPKTRLDITLGARL